MATGFSRLLTNSKPTNRQLDALPDATDHRLWYVNKQGHTLVIIEAQEFMMGSPESEPDRDPGPREKQFRCHIGRRFAIAATEVTREQYQMFRKNRPQAFHPQPAVPGGRGISRKRA